MANLSTEEMRVYVRERRERFKAAGKCVLCGKRKPAAGMSVCPTCRRKAKRRRDKLVAKQLAEGMCSSCLKRPPKPGLKTCQRCLDMATRNRIKNLDSVLSRQRRNQKRRSARNKAKGICVTCGKRRAAKGRVHCRPCLDISNGRQRGVAKDCIARGICPRCRKRPSAEGIQMCQPCRDAWAEYQQKRRLEAQQSGICDSCRKVPAEPGLRKCRPCLTRCDRNSRAYKKRKDENAGV